MTAAEWSDLDRLQRELEGMTARVAELESQITQLESDYAAHVARLEAVLAGVRRDLIAKDNPGAGEPEW